MLLMLKLHSKKFFLTGRSEVMSVYDFMYTQTTKKESCTIEDKDETLVRWKSFNL